MSIKNWNDVIELQRNLNIVSDWFTSSKLMVNVAKCRFMIFTRKCNSLPSAYSINSQVLPRVNEFCDLGVTFDSRLSFAPHINNLCISASKVLGFVMRTCKYFRNPSIFKTLFYSFVASKLAYASPVWSPHYIYLQLQLEKIQRRFLKFLSFKLDGVYPVRNIDYGALLDRHGMRTVASRRERQGARFMWKLVHGTVDCPNLLSSLNFLVPRISSRSPPTFCLPIPRTNLLSFSPITSMCRLADSLYEDVFYTTINDL